MITSIKYISDSWSSFDDIVANNLVNGIKVLEIGAGANPYLSPEICEKYNVSYYIQDIDQQELEKAIGSHYIKIQDLSSCNEKFDLIITKMVLEHIKDPNQFHAIVYNLLNKEGKAIHFFATLYNIASTANKILPNFLSNFLQRYFIKRDLTQHDKFFAYYKRCYGPTKSNISFFKKLNYDIELYYGFVGHNYFWNNKLLYPLEKAWSKFLLKRKNPYACSNAIVVLHLSNKTRN